MRFDEIMAAIPQPIETTEQMSAAIDFLIDAEDVGPEERTAFIAGYCVGMSHALTAYAEEKIQAAALRLIEFVDRHLQDEPPPSSAWRPPTMEN
jgi:hypothetical protein